MTVSRNRTQLLIFLGLTIILVGYFQVWLAHHAAGLSLIGLEMGEQSKFLPQVRSGEIMPGRWLFYLPPLTVGLLVVLISGSWPENRWQTWAARALGVAISLLAFPAIEAIGTDPAEWLWRTILIGFVFLVALAAPLLKQVPSQRRTLAIVIVAFAGFLLPSWIFLEVRSAFNTLLPDPFGIGAGVWLNAFGHLMVLLLGLSAITKGARSS